MFRFLFHLSPFTKEHIPEPKEGSSEANFMDDLFRASKSWELLQN